MSIHPKWAEKIFNGEKTIEVRKIVPKLETPFKVYVYCTKGTFDITDCHDLSKDGVKKVAEGRGKVIGSFVCDWITEITPHCDIGGHVNSYVHGYPAILGDDCLSFKQLKAYLGNKKGYDWDITEPKLFDKPRELSEFKKEGFMNEKEWLYALYPNTHCHYEAWAKKFTLTRPPQSWCYVEEEECQ